MPTAHRPVIPILAAIVPLVVLTLACAGGEESTEAVSPAPAASPAAPAASPIAPEHKALCAASLGCGLLAHYPIAQVENGMCDMCGDVDERFCTSDWPSDGVPPCAMWEELERCVWQEAGARKLPDLDEPARSNVIELQQRLDNQVRCTP